MRTKSQYLRERQVGAVWREDFATLGPADQAENTSQGCKEGVLYVPFSSRKKKNASNEGPRNTALPPLSFNNLWHKDFIGCTTALKEKENKS